MSDLFDFLDTPPTPSPNSWIPEAPPSLDGITDIQLDTETTGLKWYEKDRPIGISIRLPGGRTQYLPWAHNGGNLDEVVVKEWARRELRGKHITNINTRFDIHMLREWGVDLEEQGNTVSDVSHYAALLDDHRRKFSLDVLSEAYLQDEKVKLTSDGKKLDATRMASYHAGEVAAYACKDVELVYQLQEKMLPLLREQDLMEVVQLESDVIFPVCEMEKNGAPLDVEKLHTWLKESEQEYYRCLYDIVRDVGFQVNPDSPTDMKKLFKAKNITSTAHTASGAQSFTDEVLKHIDDPTIQLARRAGKLASLRSKYLVSYSNALTSDGKLRYNLHQLRVDDHGTVRGRFSSSDKNIQQVMAVAKQIAASGDKYIIRELFIPESGLYLSADAAQIEYRIFASYAGSPKTLKAYAEDPWMSFHKYVWEIVKQHKPDIAYKALKNLNFAYMYGAGLTKMAVMLEFITQADVDELKTVFGEKIPYTHPKLKSTLELKNAYDFMFPEVQPLLRRAAELAKDRGYVHTVLGRRARFERYDRIHSALNAVIQGSAADVNKRKIVELHKARKKIGYTPRLTVHDEVCGDAADQESVKLVGELLNSQSFPQIKVPILWEVNSGANWRECA